MNYQTRLHKRKSNYYFRAKVPFDLRPFYGRAEIKFSLRTKDSQKAAHLVREKSVELDREFTALRANLATTQPQTQTVLDDKTVQGLCELWKYHALDGDEVTRREGITIDDFEQQATERGAVEHQLRQALARGQLDIIQPALQGFLHLIGVQFSGTTEDYQKLAYAFLQTITETNRLQTQRDQGEVIKTPSRPETIYGTVATGSHTLKSLLEDWIRFESYRPEKTVDDMKRTIDEFQQVVGRKHAEAITRKDVMAYRDYLIHDLGRKSKTIKKKVGFLSSLFYVAINNEKMSTNPAARIPYPKDDSEPWLPYDLDELKTIFSSPLYTEGHRLGRDTGEAGVWLPLLSLYSGCRVEELGQLLVEDVALIDEVWCLLIIDELEEDKLAKRLKTRASRRRLPIHSRVIAAGFLGYVEQMKAEGHDRLFPTLKPDKHGKLTAGFSKAYNDFISEDLKISHPRKVFHSYRHNFRDACREAGLDEEIADALMGHKGNRTGRNYGGGFSLQSLYAAMQKIGYPDLEVPVITGS